jgi:hypothetical protein
LFKQAPGLFSNPYPFLVDLPIAPFVEQTGPNREYATRFVQNLRPIRCEIQQSRDHDRMKAVGWQRKLGSLTDDDRHLGVAGFGS